MRPKPFMPIFVVISLLLLCWDTVWPYAVPVSNHVQESFDFGSVVSRQDVAIVAFQGQNGQVNALPEYDVGNGAVAECLDVVNHSIDMSALQLW